MRGAVTETEEESQARRSAAVWASGHEAWNQAAGEGVERWKLKRDKEVGGMAALKKGWRERSTQDWDTGIPVGETERPQQDEEQDGRRSREKGLPSLESWS